MLFPESSEPSLRSRFGDLWARAVGPDDPSRPWRRLDDGYGADGRHYHGWPHVAAMRAGLDRSVDEAGLAADPRDALALAIFFHDAVYDPRRSDNEPASAALLSEEAGPDPRLGRDGLARVCEMILATADHRPSADRATRLLCDLDLAVLGALDAEYAAYAQAIRREYEHVPEPVWRLGRAAVLQRFLARDRLYQTPSFAALYEAGARANLRGELAMLAT